MLRPTILIPLVISSFFLAAHLVNKEVQQPYLDEIFHIPQAQKYCRGTFGDWDPSITTPPGIYLISTLTSFITHTSCSVPFLRTTNLILGSIVLPLLCSSIINSSSPSGTLRNRNLTIGWIVCTFPLVFFFSLLYYTDVGSVCSVLLCLALARRGKHRWAALAGWGSLWFRQTNIVWVGFTAIDSVLREIESRKPLSVGEDKDLVVRPLLIQDLTGKPHFSPLLPSLSSPLTHLISSPLPLLQTMSPYLPVLLSFLGFLRWNGGIVLGHQEMHSISLHWAQMGYFLGFAGVMGWGVLLDEGIMVGYRGAVSVGLGSWRRRIVSGLVLGLMLLAVHYGTVVHPFLLADNRHYFFYIWRRVFGIHWVIKYAMCLVYLSCFWAWVWKLGRTHTLVWLLAFTACTGAVLIPTPLVEPRYFMVPYLILRLESVRAQPGRTHNRWLFVELGGNALINLITLYVFLTFKFEWTGWEGAMRFMW